MSRAVVVRIPKGDRSSSRHDDIRTALGKGFGAHPPVAAIATGIDSARVIVSRGRPNDGANIRDGDLPAPVARPVDVTDTEASMGTGDSATTTNLATTGL